MRLSGALVRSILCASLVTPSAWAVDSFTANYTGQGSNASTCNMTFNISGQEPTDYVDVVPLGPIAAQRELLANRIRALTPTQGTPLYTAVGASYSFLLDDFDAAKINALVVLSDGRNEDPRNPDIGGLLTTLRSTNEGQTTRPVRIFPIAFSGDADFRVLQQIAEATNAAAYDATDPTTITRVFTAVVSNF